MLWAHISKFFIKIIPCAIALATIFFITEALADNNEKQIELLKSVLNELESGQYPDVLRVINNAAERNDENYLMPGNLGSIWTEIAKYYPPARTSLEAYRNKNTSSLATGKFDKYKLEVILEINESLGENYRSVELLREIDATTPHRDGSLFNIAEKILVDGGAYQLARHYMGKNPEKIFSSTLKKAKYLRGYIARNDSDATIFKSGITSDIQELVGIITILENTGDNKLARKLEDQLIKEWDGPEVDEALAARKRRPM